ncbi:MAG: hypothetical protein WCL57_03080 [Chloroflexota bacterium]|nr:hypothetical protein [Chloroflexota bacterium]
MSGKSFLALAQAFRRYFQVNPSLARSFLVKVSNNGGLDTADLQTLINERVMVQL